MWRDYTFTDEMPPVRDRLARHAVRNANVVPVAPSA
jgi:hypothetical protein